MGQAGISGQRALDEVSRGRRVDSIARVRHRLHRCLTAAAVVAMAACGSAFGMASHAGWPPDEHHQGHPNNESGVMHGLKSVHNYLLGGNGNDTIWAGDAGDVVWGDSHPSGQPESQRDYLHGGRGADWLYASHGFNEIWTGAGNDHIALVYGHGVVHCDGPGLKTFVMRYLPSNRPWSLQGCAHKVIVPYRA
jgi:RTX calcium-binding nonapeptide repeat (4 copies)